jgi:hypothetical protein
MLANSFSSSFSIGVPNFTYSFKLEDVYESTLIEAVPEFIHGLVTFPRTKRLDEEGFSQEFVTALNRYLINNPKGILAVPEYKDFYIIGANPVKRVDIAFVSSEQGASKIKLYTVEAKRLPTGTGIREKEYIYGFFSSGSPSGGIQRFKTGDHGYGLPKSALLGYVEENDFSYWHQTINDWIAFKAEELPEEWKEDEQLQKLKIDSNQNFSVSRSIAYRENDTLGLFHLWIKINDLG